MAERTLIVENGKANGSHFFHVGDGYFYHLHREEMSAMYFRCKHSHCRGRAIFKFGSGFEHTQPHCHAPDILYTEVNAARTSIVNEARSMNYMPFSDIIRRQKQQIPNMMVRSQLTLRSLRSAMQRARGGVFPHVPETLLRLCWILEDPMWESLTRTNDFQDSIYLGTAIGSDVSVNVVFISSRGLQLLREAVIVFADGTFYIAPSVEGCYQVFTLITIHGHTIIPLCWCLMQNKSQAGYEAVLSLIRDHLGQWNFSSVICDFEDAIINAFKLIFNVDVQGCLFHASHDMAAYAKETIGLALMQCFEELQLIVRMGCAVPLLPMHLLQSGLNAIGSAAMDLGDFFYGIVRPFLAYMQHSWLEHPNRGPSMSVCGSVHRTNNASESNNRQMKRKFGVQHPNVYHFVRTVVNFEAEAIDDLASLQRGLTPTRHRRVTAVASDAFIIQITNALLRDPDPSDQVLINFLLQASTAIQGLIQEALH